MFIVHCASVCMNADGSIPGLGRGENFTYQPNSEIG